MPSLRELEADVEAARAKLAGDLAVLTSPSSRQEFKITASQEAGRLKDLVLLRAKERSRTKIRQFVDGITARAVENPAAVLAIGAGLAWHFLRKPPITTALVGAGLVSLIRTPGDHLQVGDNLASRAGERLHQQASDFAEQVASKATSIAEAATEKAGEIVSTTKDQVGRLADQAANAAREALASPSATALEATHSVQKAGEITAENVVRAAAGARTVAVEWSRPVQRAFRNEEVRDRLLLGSAAVAITAALTLAVERRISGSPD